MKILVMMIGAPGSGKSTLARRLASMRLFAQVNIIVSSDKIRERLFGDETCQKDNHFVFQMLEHDVKEAFSMFDNVAVFIDACNTNRDERERLVATLAPYFDKAVAIYHDGPKSECIERNNARDRIVPEYVIDRMYGQAPYAYELFPDFDAVIPFSVAENFGGI